MGAEESRPASQLYIGRSKFGGEGCCRKIQRTFGLHEEGMSGQLRRWADKEREKSRKKAGDLGNQTDKHAARIKQERDKARAERERNRKEKREKHSDVMGDFKAALRGGMQVRQHLPKGKVRDVKIWVTTRGPDKKKPANISSSDWQNNCWYFHLGSEARNNCWFVESKLVTL